MPSVSPVIVQGWMAYNDCYMPKITPNIRSTTNQCACGCICAVLFWNMSQPLCRCLRNSCECHCYHSPFKLLQSTYVLLICFVWMTITGNPEQSARPWVNSCKVPVNCELSLLFKIVNYDRELVNFYVWTELWAHSWDVRSVNFNTSRLQLWMWFLHY